MRSENFRVNKTEKKSGWSKTELKCFLFEKFLRQHSRVCFRKAFSWGLYESLGLWNYRENLLKKFILILRICELQKLFRNFKWRHLFKGLANFLIEIVICIILSSRRQTAFKIKLSIFKLSKSFSNDHALSNSTLMWNQKFKFISIGKSKAKSEEPTVC